MRIFKFTLLTLVPLLFLSGNYPSEDTACRTIIARFLKSINSIKTQECIVKSVENFEGSLTSAESFIKLNIKPKKNIL